MTSAGAVEWAFQQRVDSAASKLVLLVLAWHGWESSLSQEEIAEETGQSARTVRRGMDWLESNGLIRRERRFDEKGHRVSDRCALGPESPPANMATGQNGRRSDWPEVNMSAPPDQQEPPTGQNDHRSKWPRNKDSPTESLFPNPSPTGKGGAGGNQTRSSPKKPKEHPGFAEWYAAYPVRKARGAAVTAYAKALTKTDPASLLAAAKRYRDDEQVARGYGKHPATWLNQECWLDEPARAPNHAATGTDGARGHGPRADVNGIDWSKGGPRL